ncbi:MAG: hypothetical protein U1D29_10150 [Burkholderiales bacterium]|nr:hypothetical protein [Burkholderiales bacterium]
MVYSSSKLLSSTVEDDARTKMQHLQRALSMAMYVASSFTAAEDLRIELAAVLTLQFKLTVPETAMALGKSRKWVASQKRKFLHRASSGWQRTERRGGRRNELMPAEEEEAFLEKVCKIYIDIHVYWRTTISAGAAAYQKTEVTFIDHMLRELVAHAGRPVSKATAYNIMARVGRRRFDPYHASNWTWYCRKDLPNAVYAT